MKQSDSLNWRLTCVVGDLLNHFQQLQKEAQRTFIMMADLLNQRDQLSSLKGTDPGGREEKHQPQPSQQATNEDDPLLPSRQSSIH